MKETLSTVLEQIESADPQHGRKLRETIAPMNSEFFERAERHYAGYRAAMKGAGKSLDFGIRCYLKLRDDMQVERMRFVRTGQYAHKSYKEVEQSIYSRPEVMDYHMHGLAMAQFLWSDQYQRIKFFCDNLPRLREGIRSYLEIGGGHGLYTREALALLRPGTKIDLVDISRSSLELARLLIDSPKVNFFLADIFEWERPEKYDFITIAEVIEHVENPAAMLARVGEMLQPDGTVFLTTPVNAPMIDHIYLFNHVQEIRDLVASCGFQIASEKWATSDDVPEAKAIRYKLPIMYAAFLKKQ